MEKTKNHLDLLWMHTLHIDTWIVEHITFSKNNWGQRVPIGSCLVCVHEEPHQPDVIRYDRSPRSDSKNDDDKDALFLLHFYNDHFEFILYDRRNEGEGIKLQYEDPTMFDKLESLVWNARTIDYIYSDLNTMEENLRLLRNGLWDNPTKFVRKGIGGLSDVYQRVAQLEEHVRYITRYFCEDPAKSLNAKARQQPLIEDDRLPHEDDDEIPF
jgi:hypothetical protein